MWGTPTASRRTSTGAVRPGSFASPSTSGSASREQTQYKRADPAARTVAQDVVAEHPQVPGIRLEEEDVDLGVLGTITLEPVLHAPVQHDAQGLVEDVGDAATAQRSRQRTAGAVVAQRDHRVD